VTRILSSLSEIGANYAVALVDLWGCVHDGLRIYPAAQAALQTFRAGGGVVILVTNAPRTASVVQARLDDMGLARDAYDSIVTSGDATQEAMLMGAVGTRVWHLGPPKDDDLFDNLPDWAQDRPAIQRVPFDEAEGIVCTGLFDDTTEHPDDYRGRFLSAKARGLKMLCANPDLVVDYGETRLWCAGALAQLYDQMGGESLYFGKPHPPIYDMARRIVAKHGLKWRDDSVIAIGDGIATDVQGGLGEGFDTLFITGGLSADLFGPDVENPASGMLTDWLDAQGRHPTYAIGRLR
jgi:HAD superfamily hydrolase (TIGR01459 family)